MRSELHLDPDRLRDAAVVAADLADELRAAPVPPPTPEPAADRLGAAVQRASRQLAELGVALSAAADAAQRDDLMVAASLHRLRART